MIVYVESNFVLELALDQDESAAAEAILNLAEQQRIALSYPTFALIEPYWTIRRRSGERRNLSNSLERELRQIRRSRPHQESAAILERAPLAILEVIRREENLLERTIQRLLTWGRPIEISGPIFENAIVYQDRFDFGLQDAVMFASIVADLRVQDSGEAKCFISRDKEAFASSDTRSELALHNCRYVERFRNGLAFVQSRLA